jgi:transcriptional regulator with XRE-family HTH domain
LRREEVAALSGMSTDYYSRLEQQRGPQPSEQMLAAIARGLHLSLAERDHLFQLGGHNAPTRTLRTDHISPGLLRVLDRLDDTPAQVVTGLAETLAQTRLAVALLGEQTGYTGLARSMVYRWFTDPSARRIHPSRTTRCTAGYLPPSCARRTPSRGRSPGRPPWSRHCWRAAPSSPGTGGEHEVGLTRRDLKRIQHPEGGILELHCQLLFDPEQSQALLVFTATPGSDSYQKLQLLSVIGPRSLDPTPP